MIEAIQVRPGVYIARRYCTRIAQHLEAYHATYSERWRMCFPVARIEADSVDALNDALRRSLKVWA